MVFLIVVSQHRSRAKLKQPKIKSNFFTARDNDIFTKSDGVRGKEERGRKGSKKRDEKTFEIWKVIGSAASRDNLSMKRRILFFIRFFFFIRYSVLLSFSLFFFFVLLRNLQTLLVLLLTWPNLRTAGDFDFSNDRTLRGMARNIKSTCLHESDRFWFEG